MILGKLYNFLVYWVLGFYTFNHLISNPGINFWNGLSFFSLKRAVKLFHIFKWKTIRKKPIKTLFWHICALFLKHSLLLRWSSWQHRILSSDRLTIFCAFQKKVVDKTATFSEVSLEDNMELGRSSSQVLVWNF